MDSPDLELTKVADEIVLLRCKCGLPWATVKDGQLLVQSKHFGQRHINSISLAELMSMLSQGGEMRQVPLPMEDRAEGICLGEASY